MSTIIIGIVVAVAFAAFYLPVYLPFLVSLKVPLDKWRELKFALIIASAISLFLVLSAERPDFGNDVAGNFAGSAYNFKIVWGRGLLADLICVAIGFLAGGIRKWRIRRGIGQRGHP